MSPSDVRLHPTLTPRRAAAFQQDCPGPRVADSARTRATDTELGHITLRTLEGLDASPLDDADAAGLGRLVRKIVNSHAGLPDGFDSVEDLSRAYLDAVRSRPGARRSRDAAARTLTRLRNTAQR